MTREIAVCLNDSGITSSLYDASALVVYQKKQGNWNVVRERNFSLDQQAGMVGLRRQMAEVLPFMDSCRIFVGWSVVGIPYFELEKMQCSIWEFEGAPLAFLDYVLEKEEERMNESQSKVSTRIAIPQERENGDYYISIKEVQENSGGITSKQVLLPFLRQGKFYSLEVVCNHVPPWLEMELTGDSLTGRIEKVAPMEIHIYIRKRGCGES